MKNQMFDSAVDFSLYVENQAYQSHSSVLETLIKIIDECGFDIDKIKPMISESLKDKLKKDFVDIGMMKKETSIFDMLS